MGGERERCRQNKMKLNKGKAETFFFFSSQLAGGSGDTELVYVG